VIALPGDLVTFLVMDLTGRTPPHLADPPALPAALLRPIIATHAGSVFQTGVDALCAAFPHAPAALAAALAVQRALATAPAEAGEPLPARLALHSGRVTGPVGAYDDPSLNRALHLLHIGHAGQIFLTRATQLLVADALPVGIMLQDLGEHRLRDLTPPEQVFQVWVPNLPADFPPLRSGPWFSVASPCRGSRCRNCRRFIHSLGPTIRNTGIHRYPRNVWSCVRAVFMVRSAHSARPTRA
jgi:class 3 adenylate cyclase